MAKHSIDRELSNYWEQLTPPQKQSVLALILSFKEENKNINKPDITDSNELQEPEAEYNMPWEIFKPLSKQQKKALIRFLESSGIEPAGRISIEQYNKELEEAEARIDAGEFYTHEEVIEMSKTWVKNGK